MEKLFAAGRMYMKDMDLEDMAALKVCCISLGVLMGLGIPLRSRRAWGVMTSFLFLGTCIPLVSKFLFTLTHPREDG